MGVEVSHSTYRRDLPILDERYRLTASLDLLQLLVLSSTLLQDGDVGIGVFPHAKRSGIQFALILSHYLGFASP